MKRLCVLVCTGSISLLVPLLVSATTYTVDIYATVAGCGDAQIQSGEQCDGSNTSGATCESLGFDSGSLTCSSACTFITAACTLNPPSSGGGTRTTNNSAASSNTNVVMFGVAPPQSTIFLLKDGQRVAAVPVKSDGTFQVTLAGLGAGTFRFSLIGEKSGFSPIASEAIPVRVLKGATTKVGPVTLPPFTRFLPNNGQVTVEGYAPGNDIVSLFINGTPVKEVKPAADGFFEFEFTPDQSVTLQVGVSNGDETIILTEPVYYPLRDGDTSPQLEVCVLPGDINGDCRIGPADFFISRYRYVINQFSDRFDFNKDGQISIVDFSIMAFYWTG